jgi:hypothetical protein
MMPSAAKIAPSSPSQPAQPAQPAETPAKTVPATNGAAASTPIAASLRDQRRPRHQWPRPSQRYRRRSRHYNPQQGTGKWRTWPFDPLAEKPIDRFTLSQKSREINDIIGGGNGSSLNEKLKSDIVDLRSALNDTPVRDLKKAIGVNDRYVFVNQLFRGDEVMYERSIKTINGFRILPEAEYWMERELKVKLGWDENREAHPPFLSARQKTVFLNEPDDPRGRPLPGMNIFPGRASHFSRSSSSRSSRSNTFSASNALSITIPPPLSVSSTASIYFSITGPNTTGLP